MVLVNKVYEIVLSVFLNKKQSGSVTIDAFNTACYSVNYDFLKWRVGLPEKYQVGMPQPPIAYQITQKITDDVRFLITPVTIQKNVQGYFPLPEDYFAYSSLKYRYIKNSDNCKGEPEWYDNAIAVLSDNELSERLSNTIVPPTEIYPVGAYYSAGIKVFPKEIDKINLTYLRRPVTPNWNFDLVDDQPVYKSSGSVDFEYPESCTTDIANLVLQALGVNLLMPEIVQVAEQRKTQGI